MVKRIILTIILTFGLLVNAQADTSSIIIFGKDLTELQRQKVITQLDLQGVDLRNLPSVEVTNDEERKYLQGIIPDEVIGTKAISSAYVEIADPGTGLVVQTKNITWVSDKMYATALATAQVKDARIKIAAPFPVSGTAALTGIMKAFEVASGTELSEEAKRVANEELVQMGELGQELGDKDKAAQLYTLVKEQVVGQRLESPEEIKKVIQNVAVQLNIQLTEEQINQLIELMQKIGQLDLNVADLKNQLETVKAKLGELTERQEEVKGFFAQLLAALQEFIDKIRSLFG